MIPLLSFYKNYALYEWEYQFAQLIFEEKLRMMDECQREQKHYTRLPVLKISIAQRRRNE